MFLTTYLVIAWAACVPLVWWQSRLEEFRNPLGVLGMAVEFLAAPLWIPLAIALWCEYALIKVVGDSLDIATRRRR